jgi:hypothetical protein
MQPPLPAKIKTIMAQRDHRMHHYVWHQVRNGWNFYDAATRDQIAALGWAPPRPALEPLPPDDRRPVFNNFSGEDFLYMHRQMIAFVNNELTNIGDPAYRKVIGWQSLPSPNDVDFAVPPTWDTGNVDLNQYLQETKSDDFFKNTMQPSERHYTDSAFLRSVSLGELGARIEFTIHNRMHMRWCTKVSQMRPDVDPAKPDEIDPKWDSPDYDWLGDTYSSHVHQNFWKIHGWVDDQIEAWKTANGTTGEIQWKGTWVGKMPNHPQPSSLHALLTTQAQERVLEHDHGAELNKVLRVILRSGIRCNFYDKVVVE